MAARDWWVAAALVLLAACGSTSTSTVTPPRSAAGSRPPAPSRRWGPVAPPPNLVAATAAYYDGAGPAPSDEVDGRPACDLLLPTGLDSTPLATVPSSGFNVFREFVVGWNLAPSGATGLTLTVIPAGDPADRRFYDADAQLDVLDDGSQIRRTPTRPRAALVRVVNQNCEYEVAPAAGLPDADDGPILSSLRLMFAP